MEMIVRVACTAVTLTLITVGFVCIRYGSCVKIIIMPERNSLFYFSLMRTVVCTYLKSISWRYTRCGNRFGFMVIMSRRQYNLFIRYVSAAVVLTFLMLTARFRTCGLFCYNLF